MKKKYIYILLIFLFSMIFSLLTIYETSPILKEDDSLITNVVQKSPELKHLEGYTPTKYSIDNPYIEKDVFDFNTLSAYVAFPISKNASYSYTVKGKDEYSSFSFEDTTLQKDDIVIPIIGLYENYNNTVDISINYEDGQTEQIQVSIKTEKVSDYITKNINIDTSYSNKEIAYNSLEGGFIIDNRCNMYDINGDIRVALEIENLDYSGNALRINYDNSFLMGTKDYVYNLSMTGRVLYEYKAPEGYYINHDYISCENGYTYAILSPTDENMTYTDDGFKEESYVGVYETNKSEYPVTIFDINKLVKDNEVNAINTLGQPQDELLHLNAIAYDYYTNTLMISSQSQNAIIAIDATSGEMRWIIADDELVKTNKDKVLTKTGDFSSANGQHNIQVTNNPKYDDNDETTIELMLYNNNFCLDINGNPIYTKSSKDSIYDQCEVQDFSSLLVYRIDTENLTVKTLDEFSIDGFYSSIRSSWFQSYDYEYNYITYGDTGQLVVTDVDFNIIFICTTKEDGFYQNMYRTRVFSKEELENISKYANYYED